MGRLLRSAETVRAEEVVLQVPGDHLVRTLVTQLRSVPRAAGSSRWSSPCPDSFSGQWIMSARSCKVRWEGLNSRAHQPQRAGRWRWAGEPQHDLFVAASETRAEGNPLYRALEAALGRTVLTIMRNRCAGNPMRATGGGQTFLLGGVWEGSRLTSQRSHELDE